MFGCLKFYFSENQKHFLMLCLFTFSSCMLCSSFSLALILMSCQKVLAKCYFLTHGEQFCSLSYMCSHAYAVVCCENSNSAIETVHLLLAYSIGLIKGSSVIISVLCHNFFIVSGRGVCVVLGIDTRALYVLGKHSIPEPFTHEF